MLASVSNVLGNFALSLGMRHLNVAGGGGAARDGLIGAGVCLLAVWMLSQLSLLSWADLSYVLPLTASSYALAAMLGALVLHEAVPLAHWAGIGLISLGVMCVGRTPPRTGAAE